MNDIMEIKVKREYPEFNPITIRLQSKEAYEALVIALLTVRNSNFVRRNGFNCSEGKTNEIIGMLLDKLEEINK